MADSEPARRSLRDLPKAHLHLHLVGSMRPETLVTLGNESGASINLPTDFDSFAHFLDTYRMANEAIRSADDLGRLVHEVLEDAKADGAVWVEPSLYLDSFKDVIGPGELILEIVTDALRSAREQVGIGVKLIAAAQRDLGPADALRQARLATRADPDIVGAFGLVNDEPGNPIEGFAESFAIAAGAGLALTPHAGEFGHPEQVAAALGFDVARIQHGIAAAGEGALMEHLAERGVCLDVCPTSNVALGAVTSLEEHPLTTLLDNGIPVSLNADDPLLFSCSLLGEYELARQVLGLGDHQIASIAEASIAHSTAPEALKASSSDGIREWLARGD